MTHGLISLKFLISIATFCDWSQPENKNTESFSGNWELISALGSLDPLKVL